MISHHSILTRVVKRTVDVDWVVVGSVVDRFALGYSARPIARACTSYIAVSVKYYVLDVSLSGKANGCYVTFDCF